MPRNRNRDQDRLAADSAADPGTQVRGDLRRGVIW
jgi:hypothetical protein